MSFKWVGAGGSSFEQEDSSRINFRPWLHFYECIIRRDRPKPRKCFWSWWTFYTDNVPLNILPAQPFSRRKSDTGLIASWTFCKWIVWTAECRVAFSTTSTIFKNRDKIRKKLEENAMKNKRVCTRCWYSQKIFGFQLKPLQQFCKIIWFNRKD